jgi:aryl-alcohol dehydrogenase-like predicted oxidoreductase
LPGPSDWPDPPEQIALAGLLVRPVIAAPIVGATKLPRLDDSLAAVTVRLFAQEIALLEEPYVPHAVAGFARKTRGRRN